MLVRVCCALLSRLWQITSSDLSRAEQTCAYLIQQLLQKLLTFKQLLTFKHIQAGPPYDHTLDRILSSSKPLSAHYVQF